MSKPRQEFKTTNNKVWKYFSPKVSGLVKGGEHTGFYIAEDKEKGITKALIKQDKTIHNISEFLAGKIYQKLIPDYSANILLTKVEDVKEPSEDGSEVYLVSEFVPGFQGELYTEIQAELKRDTERSRHALMEGLQIFYQQLKYLPTVFQRLTQEGHFKNYGEVNGASFIINNLDIHSANFIVVKKESKDCKQLGVIDYGFAWREMTPKINPHSFTKCLLTNAIRLEGWNNFIYYPPSVKVTSAFVAGLDKMANIDLSETVNAAFDDLTQFYSMNAILQFMVKTNLISSHAADFYHNQYKDYDNDRYTQYILNIMKNKINTILKTRQTDLLRFSAQIKMDLCLTDDPASGAKKSLRGYEDSITHQYISFEEVVFQHISYFIEIHSGKEKFKFRNPQNKTSVLNDLVLNESAVIIAGLICTDEVICKHFEIQTLDRAFELLQKGVLKGDELFKSIRNPSPEKVFKAKEMLSCRNSLILMAKTHSLKTDNIDLITQLIKKGSNPNMNLPDGSKLIDYVDAKNDFSILRTLVQHGAKITHSVIKNITKGQSSILIRDRESFLRTQGKCFLLEPIGYSVLSLFSSRADNQDDHQKREEKIHQSLSLGV